MIIFKSFFKYIFIVFLFFIFALIQQGFLPHFEVLGVGINLLFISVFFLNFWGKQENKTNIFVSALAGLLLDVVSPLPFGLFILAFIVLSILIQRASTFFHEPSLFSFLTLFFLSFLLFKLLSIASFLNPLIFIFEFLYNLAFSLIIFLLFSLCLSKR